MDDELEVIVEPPSPFYLLPKFYLLSILVFVIFFGIGFSVSKFSPLLKPKAINNFSINESVKTPISLDLLQNPMFSNWTARVEGQVVAKWDQSFTIAHIVREFTSTGSATVKRADDNHFLEITYIPEKVKFKKVVIKNLEDVELIDITLADLPIDSIVTGTIEINQTNNRLSLIGKNFTIN